MKTLYIIRGVSGAGKTTLAKTLCGLPNTVAIAADDYHYDEEGNYNWKAENMSKAHQWCKEVVEKKLEAGLNVVVHNTNTSEKEIKPYLDLADKYKRNVVSLVVENRHGNTDVHNVPLDIKVNQERRLRSSLKLS